MRLAVAIAVLLALATPAGAHVVVLPETSVVGAPQRYTVVVPTEGASPTVRVELRLPPGVDVAALEAKPGWDAEHRPLPIGAATIAWSGGRIPPGQMLSFDFLAANPQAARVLSWNATQWYEDGTSDHWGAGAPEGHEASTTALTVASGGQAASAHAKAAGAAAAAPAPGAPPARPRDELGTASAPAALWISLVALVIAVAALLAAVRSGAAGGALRAPPE